MRNDKGDPHGRPATSSDHSSTRVPEAVAGSAPATPLQLAVRHIAAAFEVVRDDDEARDWLCEIAGIHVARGFREQLARKAA